MLIFWKRRISCSRGSRTSSLSKRLPGLPKATARPGKEGFLSVLEIDHAVTLTVQPDKGSPGVRDQPDAEGVRIKIDQFSVGQETALGKTNRDSLSRVPFDAALSQEMPLLRQ